MNLFEYFSGRFKINHSIDTKPSPDDFSLHAHRMFELYYFISGNCYYTVEGIDYPLEPGYILLMRDGEAHMIHVRSDEPYERISIHFTQDVISLISDAAADLFLNKPLGKDNLLVPGEESANFIKSCLKKICHDSPEKLPEGQVTSYLLPIISELHRVKRNSAEQSSEPIMPVQHGSSETVGKIIEYIHDNLVTIKDLEELEREFFFSKSYINRIFKDSTGSSVWDFIVLKRLLLSRTLLQEGKQANIVASECGFCDYSSFYRQFKKRFGISPLEARGK